MLSITIIITMLAMPVMLLVWSYISLQRNMVVAKKVGFPVVIRWVSPSNPFWMIIGSTIAKTCIKLYIGPANFWRMYYHGWEGRERCKIHEEHGDIFMLVAPNGIWLCVSDADAINDVIRRPKEFPRHLEEMAVLDVYGRSLATTDGEDWQRHRKVTAATFTERNNELVWREAINQSTDMLAYWIKHQPVTKIADDTKNFSLNVLAAAIFNKHYPFEGSESKEASTTKDGSFQYRDSLSTILSSIIQIFIFGEEGLKAWWTPKSWKKAAVAIDIFRSYILGLIEEERNLASSGSGKNQYLVAALVRACESEKQAENEEPRSRKMTLTETEIISNLFVYAFAGNDTTAISLTHILVDIAAHPYTQGWLAEEIHYYLPSGDPTRWEYSTFPKLKRCLAVVYESLRLNHPLSQLVKYTKEQSQTIRVGETTHTLPPGTHVHLSMAALHTHPRYWGEDSMKWRPERFITSTQAGIEHEMLAPDTSANFLPWAHGQRLCPGKKFSQVEIVAALAVLFRDHVVAPQVKPGQSLEDARAMLFERSMEVNHQGTALFEIDEPQKVHLEWSKRKR